MKEEGLSINNNSNIPSNIRKYTAQLHIHRLVLSDDAVEMQKSISFLFIF